MRVRECVTRANFNCLFFSLADGEKISVSQQETENVCEYHLGARERAHIECAIFLIL